MYLIQALRARGVPSPADSLPAWERSSSRASATCALLTCGGSAAASTAVQCCAVNLAACYCQGSAPSLSRGKTDFRRPA
jgi:hypothetical protein